jgi:SAM-dependent methyltransferase
MLDSEQEFLKMAAVEHSHWWYRTLHESIFNIIIKHTKNINASIIDAGCGSGGLLQFLQDRGMKSLMGIDLSKYAVDICKEKGLEVEKGDILNLTNLFPEKSADIIVSNDVMYFLSKEEQKHVINSAFRILRPEGLFVLNLPALEIFRGTHDIAVGIKARYNRAGIVNMVNATQFDLKYFRFWPFFLSPAIFAIRFLQRIKLMLKASPNVESDIDLPPRMINNILYNICRLEMSTLTYAPFGSSIFLVLKKYN